MVELELAPDQRDQKAIYYYYFFIHQNINQLQKRSTIVAL